MKFRRKQTEVDAVQFVDGRYGEAIDFCPQLDIQFGFGTTAALVEGDTKAKLIPTRRIDAATIEGKPVKNGDWIVKDENGVCTVKSDEEFAAEYQAT